MQIIKADAIVLRRTNYGEADRIINLLTRDHGKVSAMAKGVRRAKSKLAGGIELFAVCEVTLMGGKGGMYTLTSARIKEFYSDILKNYDTTQAAYDVIKQINRVAESVDAPEFFELLKDSLESLNARVDYRLVELCFKLKRAELLGKGLNLETDILGKKLKSDIKYNFNFVDMAFEESASGRFTADHIKILRLSRVKSPRVVNHIAGLDAFLNDCLMLAQDL